MLTLISLLHLFSMWGAPVNINSELSDNPFFSNQKVELKAVDWSTWQEHERRMNWWKENGWQIIDGQKEGVTVGRISLPNALNENWSPLDSGLVPNETNHLAYQLNLEKTLVIYSLERCEILYGRYLQTLEK